MQHRAFILSLAFLLALPATAHAEFLSQTNPSIRNNLCVGAGCAETEGFSGNFNQIEIKDTNTRLLFDDTSNFQNFALNDWAIQANDRVDNGDAQLIVVDVTAGREIALFKAGAATHTLVVGTNGHVGIGTETPLQNLHIVDGLDAMIRMQTTGSDSYNWDIGGNSVNFFVYDADNTTLPLRVLAGGDNGTLVIETGGRVGINTGDQAGSVDVQAILDVRGDGLYRGDDAALTVRNTSASAAARQLLNLENNGQTYFSLTDTSLPAGPNSGRTWNFQNLGGEFRVTTAPGGGSDIEMRLTTGGDMIIEGNYFASSGQQLNVPDYVFDADYDLKPLSEVAAFIADNSHLPDVPSAADINAQGLNMTDMQMRLLKKVEELTLYTLEQQDALAAQSDQIARQAATIALQAAGLQQALARLDRLEPARAD